MLSIALAGDDVLLKFMENIYKYKYQNIYLMHSMRCLRATVCPYHSKYGLFIIRMQNVVCINVTNVSRVFVH